MDLVIRFTDGSKQRITGVTGDPLEVDITFRSGIYRDIFTLESNVTGLNYTGTEGALPGTAASIQVPDAVYGRLVPENPVVIQRLANDVTQSELAVPGFTVAVSDELAHIPPRQIQYQEAFWAFPCTVGSETLYAKFRKFVVEGWGPPSPDAA